MILRLASAVVFATCLVAANRELIVCGSAEVYILDLNRKPVEKVWSWRASDSPEIPEAMRPQFRNTDECKSVDGGKRILITSSSDGIALVERATRKALFYASAGGAHSAEMLPSGLIAVASSVSLSALSNRLVLFDSKRSGVPLFDTALVSGHGVVWDERRQVLWVLGLRTLSTYRLTDKPALVQESASTLPEWNGHDLMAAAGTDLLSVSTHSHVWKFDRAKKAFAPHPHLANTGSVKSVSVHPQTGEIVWTVADRPAWWTATLRFLNPESTIVRTGERLYKARWVASGLP
jgi:hypothetical protein